MLYKGSLTIPANTTKADPEIAYLRVAEGVVRKWFVGFPPGCAALAHLAIYRHEQKVMPEGEAESLAWNDYIFEIAEDLELRKPPYRLKLVGWNEDDIFDHTITVAAEVFPIPAVTTEGLLQRFLGTFVGG